MLSFYPRECKLSLFSLYGQHFTRYGPIFKIAIFGHETLQLAKAQKFQKLHIYKLYIYIYTYTRDQNWAYFRSTVNGFRDADRFLKLPYLPWNLAIGQSSTYTLFLRGSIYSPNSARSPDFSGPNHQSQKKNSLITKISMYYESVDSRFHAALLSCRERFTCYIYSLSPITQFLQGLITMHGKCMFSPFSTPGGQSWAYFRSTGSGLIDTGHFLNCHIWAWN